MTQDWATQGSPVSKLENYELAVACRLPWQQCCRSLPAGESMLGRYGRGEATLLGRCLLAGTSGALPPLASSPASLEPAAAARAGSVANRRWLPGSPRCRFTRVGSPLATTLPRLLGAAFQAATVHLAKSGGISAIAPGVRPPGPGVLGRKQRVPLRLRFFS